MYTDEDLESAVEKGIFSAESLSHFRDHMATQRHSPRVDEENFKLVSSFNDIFVVIACGLLLLSIGWTTYGINPSISMMALAVVSWLLAEFFVLKRKMALPAIVLLSAFVGTVFASIFVGFEQPSETAVSLGAIAAAVAALVHWKRFQVPITVAAGAMALVMCVISVLLGAFPSLKDYLSQFMFVGGCLVFCFAMYWDSRDTERVTHKSDVAFWLHLAAAPLIVHPVFSSLGILEGDESLLSGVVILCLYLLLTLISLVIDRRAFMVSSLIYVIVALTTLLKSYGFSGDSFAYIGVLLGVSLLVLSGYWHHARQLIVGRLPNGIQQRVPTLAT